jgi:hypothetical protein
MSNFAAFNLKNPINVYPMNGLEYSILQNLTPEPQDIQHPLSAMRVGNRVFGMKESQIAAFGLVTDIRTVTVDCEETPWIGIDWSPATAVSVPGRFAEEVSKLFTQSDNGLSSLVKLPPLLGEALNLVSPDFLDSIDEFGNRSFFAHTLKTRQNQVLLKRTDITHEKKLALLEALHGMGEFRNRVYEHHAHCPFLQQTTIDEVIVHIRPWDECTDEQRLDPENALVLGAEYAHYFTSGFITFMENGHYCFSGAMDNDVWMGARGGWEEFSLGPLSAGLQAYLDYHRKYVFEKWLLNRSTVMMNLPEEMVKPGSGWIPAPTGNGHIFKDKPACFDLPILL